MIKAYKYRLSQNEEQRIFFGKSFGLQEQHLIGISPAGCIGGHSEASMCNFLTMCKMVYKSLNKFFPNRQKGRKYNNKKVEYDGILFDSKKEKDRFVVLKEAEEQGVISNLQRQVKFELIPPIKETYIKHLKTKDKEETRTVQLAISYICDFQYEKNGVIVVEDVKASPNLATLDKAFLIKEKLFRWKFGYSIKRVYKPNEKV